MAAVPISPGGGPRPPRNGFSPGAMTTSRRSAGAGVTSAAAGGSCRRSGDRRRSGRRPRPRRHRPSRRNRPKLPKRRDEIRTSRHTDRRRRAAEWPGFRGPGRDGVVRGVRIDTDWSTSPPVEMWRRPIGPGWSSFAVRGDLLYTQEQRGDDEIVACYKVSTGEPVWRHRDPVRFWESNGGAGPRATPTLSNGRVYTLRRDRHRERARCRDRRGRRGRATPRPTPARTVPDWGFSSSPLVVDDVVIVAAVRHAGRATTRRPASRAGPARPTAAATARRICATIDGVAAGRAARAAPGATSVAPADGTVLWKHDVVGPARSCSRR